MNFKKLIPVLTLSIFLCSSSLIAQTEYSASKNHTPQNLETKALVILFTSDISNKKFMPETDIRLDRLDELEDLDMAAELYDRSALKEFGSYVNPYSNQMKIVTPDDVNYTKVQITNKETGETVIKQELSSGNNLLDLSLLQTGKYIIIMTDPGMNIFSEEITVI